MANLRATDVIGRYGGDEFVILLPNCRPQEAAPVMQRLRAHVRAQSLPWQRGAPALDISIGLATATFAGNESLDTLLRRADANMYEAKARAQ